MVEEMEGCGSPHLPDHLVKASSSSSSENVIGEIKNASSSPCPPFEPLESLEFSNTVFHGVFTSFGGNHLNPRVPLMS